MHASAPPPDRYPLKMLIAFITRRCNAMCSTCFYAGNLNDGSEELSIEDYTRFARGLGPFVNLLLSGGEPSMRRELPDIVDVFVRENGVGHVGFPTNALLTDRIADHVQEIFARAPQLRLDLNVSVDGLHEAHDRRRGVPGNFERLERTLGRLVELRETFPGLHVHVESVITNENWREIPAILDYMWEHHKLDGHFAEVLRGTPPEPRLAPPPDKDLELIQLSVLDNHRRYRAERRAGPNDRELELIDQLYAHQRQFLRTGRWPMPCTAGQSIVVLEPTGDVRLCELKQTVGNIRNYDYSLTRLLNDDAARDLRRSIVDDHCSCTHCVHLLDSLQASGRAAGGQGSTAGRGLGLVGAARRLIGLRE